MSWLTDPFATDFLARALVGGALVAVICGIVGTWVVIRGMAFLGEAVGHGMLPGVAVATLLGWPVIVGAAVSAVVMSLGVSALQRRARVSFDTSIGLLFVAMLALGVIVVSYSRSFATDATAILFGDILALGPTDLGLLALAVTVTAVTAAAFHRSFVAAAFDPRIAHSLGLRPRLAHAVLVGLVVLAAVSSYQAVGSLLVVGLLLGPVVAADRWTTRIVTTMMLASAIGVASVVAGLLTSWHAGTAAGPTVAGVAIGSAIVSTAARGLIGRMSRRAVRTALVRTAVVSLAVAVLAGCASGTAPSTEPGTSANSEGHGRIEGAAEVAEPQLQLVTVDRTGRVDTLDLLDESTESIGRVPAPATVSTDGRYLFGASDDGVWIVDSGVWTWDHGDHFHYYRATPRILESRVLESVTSDEPVTDAVVTTGTSSTSGGTGVFFPGTGDAVLLDNAALSEGIVREVFRIAVDPHEGMLAPVGDGALVTQPGDGDAQASVGYVDGDGRRDAGIRAECVDPRGSIETRVGVVVGCADGAVLAVESDDEVRLERIPYPQDAAAGPVTAFRNREGRPTVAGVAGGGIWLLDTRERTWQLIATPVRQLSASAVDDEDGHVVALGTDGRVRVFEAETGAELAATEPLLGATLGDPVALAGVELSIDQSRAYLNAPAEGSVFEIDYADGARIARTFTPPNPPAFLAETGL